MIFSEAIQQYGNICGEEIPKFLIFDFTTAHPLLFYSYIPIIVIVLFLAGIIYMQDRTSTINKLLVLVSSFFVFWILNILVQWVSSYHTALMLGWELTALFEVGLYISSFYFAYYFIVSKAPPFGYTAFIGTISALVLLAIPTSLNIAVYDLENCEGTLGPLWTGIYSLELLTIVAILAVHHVQNRKLTSRTEKKRNTIFTAGIAIFLLIFFMSNFAGELTQVYEFNFLGPLGMVFFLGMLFVLIVQFKAFKGKILAAQILVFALFTLIFSLFFVNDDTVIFAVRAITLLAVTVIGAVLVRSVKKEVFAREEIQTLAKNLSDSNSALESANNRLKELDAQKTEFLSIASHQFRGPLTAIKGYTSLILDGTYGEVPETMKEPIERVFSSSSTLALIVDDFLSVSRIEQGRMKYNFELHDIKDIVDLSIGELRSTVEKKGISLVFECDKNDTYMAVVDPGKFQQVTNNLVDNATKYTPKGTITVKVLRNGDRIRIEVSDTGVGIPPESITSIFEKFGRASNANEANVTGTGLGLFIVKKITEAHKGGRVWAESDGKGKGSRFIVEIDAAHVTAENTTHIDSPTP